MSILILPIIGIMYIIYLFLTSKYISSNGKAIMIFIIVFLLLFALLPSCSNTKNLYTNYPPLPENKTYTFYLPYHFVE